PRAGNLRPLTSGRAIRVLEHGAPYSRPMSKRGRHRRGGRVTPKGTRPLQVKHGRSSHRADGEPELLGEVRRRLAAEHPMSLLAEVSGLLAVIDPREENPFDREPRTGPSRDELVQSFLDVERLETSAMLAVVAEMAGDDVLRARCRRELTARAHVLPTWLARLDEVDAYRTVEMVHVLGDGDNVIIGVRFAGGRELSVVVYIDHNLGTVAKDAFAVAEPIGDLIAFMRSKVKDPDTVWRDLDPADARARITEAIRLGAVTYPRYESDTWPACRPLVEWITRLLPAGGSGYQRPGWTDGQLNALATRFFASPFGRDLDTPARRDLLDSIFWFATDYGPGDPLRWSTVAVELLLADWIPRKLVADAAYLSQAPDLLRALIRYAHHERGIRAELTAETLAAVDRWEPEYQRVIRSPRLQGAEALLAAVGLPPPKDSGEIMLDYLRSAVGGDQALADLHDRPLPDEPFAWDGIPADIRERVGGVLDLCDRACDELLDVEYRTACRRFLARVAAGDPEIFRRKARSDTAAAAVCWVVGKANELFSPYLGGLRVKDLMAHFGLAQGSVSQRAATMMRAGKFQGGPWYVETELGSPDYLVSSRRRRIMDRRDRILA
ncbi:MAG: DUF6398 domain-containing protein, partial [Actinobacteria bacterium]|nr:DUF6398 domain-containing protein [Actinomycetota bacterium]